MTSQGGKPLLLSDIFEGKLHISDSLKEIIDFIKSFFNETPLEEWDSFQQFLIDPNNVDLVEDLLDISSIIRPHSNKYYHIIENLLPKQTKPPEVLHDKETDAFNSDRDIFFTDTEYIHFSYVPVISKKSILKEKFGFNGYSDFYEKYITTAYSVSDTQEKYEKYISPIRQDNIEELQAFFATPFSSFFNLEKMLEAAAYYGSVKCFKYILMNMEEINLSNSFIAAYAIAGGNTEIIHILDQKGLAFGSHELSTSIAYHRYSLTDWILLHNTNLELSLCACIVSHNYAAFFYMLESNNDIDINKPLDKYYSPLSVLCYDNYVNLEILKYFVDKGADPNTEKSTPLYSLCRQTKINLEALKYLLEIAHADANQEFFINESDGPDSSTALFALCFEKEINIEAIKLLLPYVKDVDKGYTYAEEDYLVGKTPLYALCDNPHINNEAIRLLVEQGANVNSKNYEYASQTGHLDLDYTPLFAAVRRNNLEGIKLLLDRGANVDGESNNCGNTYTPLLLECMKPSVNISILKLLIDHGANVNFMTDDYGDDITPLQMLLTKSKNKEAIQLLFEHIDSNNKIDTFHILNDLLCSCKELSIESLSFILENGLDVNGNDPKRPTPLYYVCSKWPINHDSIRYLIEKGADVNLNVGNQTSPIYAVCSGEDYIDREALQILIDNGAEIEVQGDNKYSPLCMVCNKRYIDHDLFNLFLGLGAKVNGLDGHETSPLYYVCAQNPVDIEIMNALIDHGANVNGLEKNKITPIYSLCSWSGDYEAMKILIEHGADVNRINEINQETPLYALCKNNVSHKSLKLLIEHGANVNSINGKKQETPLYALLNKWEVDKNAANFLIEHGANIYDLPSYLQNKLN